MSKRKVMSIIGMVLMVFLIVCLFLPFISDGDNSFSLWELMDQQDRMAVNIIILIELIVGALVFLLQLCGVLDDAKFTYFTLGYYITNFIDVFITMIKRDYFKYLAIGFYLGLIISIVTLVIVIVSGFLSNGKESSSGGIPVPIGYDPKTGKPLYDKPKQIVGYNPNTGEPIYK